MTREALFQAMGDISDAWIAEASVVRPRRARMRKAFVIAAVLALLVCATAFGAGVFGSGIFGSFSWNLPAYRDIPSRETLLQDLGFSTNIVDEFSNGYRFRAGYIQENSQEAADAAVRYPGLNCEYRRGGGRMDFTVDGGPGGNRMEGAETVETYAGCALQYFAYSNKFVPEDYPLTDQDLADQASGKYEFSYYSGSKIEIDEIQELGWTHAGLNYRILAVNSDLTRNALIQMAREIIDRQ